MTVPRLARCALVLAAVLLTGAAAAAGPAPFGVQSVPNVHVRDKNNYVSDPDGILNAQATASVNRAAADLECKTGAEMAIVVLKDVSDNDARAFAADLFQHWGIGKKGKDNWLLILLVTEPPQRSVIFETGYGLESVLPDVVCYRLQQRYMVPDFKQGDFSAGPVKGVEATTAYIAADESGRAAIALARPEEQEDDAASVIVALLLIAFFLYFAKRNPRGPLWPSSPHWAEAAGATGRFRRRRRLLGQRSVRRRHEKPVLTGPHSSVTYS